MPDFKDTDEDVKKWRKKVFAATPYPPDADHYNYFDSASDGNREQASDAIYLPMRASLWTEEGEKRTTQQE